MTDALRPVDLSPVNLRGASFDTHRLERVSAGGIRFRPMFRALVSYGAFVALGLVLAATVVWRGGFPPVGKAWMGLAASLLISISGLYLVLRDARPMVFDRASGCWGRRLGWSPADTRLEEILAVQLVPKMVRTKHRHSFPNYELNVVRRDSTRMTVANYRAPERAHAEAVALAKFLECELLVASGSDQNEH